jgi:hypothetical protein
MLSKMLVKYTVAVSHFQYALEFITSVFIRFFSSLLVTLYYSIILEPTLGEKLAVFIKFKNEILRPYGLRMTGKG